MIVGFYMRYFRPGQVLEASAIGVALLLLSVAAGGWIDHHPILRVWFDHEGLTLAWWIMAYGFAAAILPVWMLQSRGKSHVKARAVNACLFRHGRAHVV
jgi:carbon starvation protein